MANLNRDIFWAQQICAMYPNYKTIGDYKLNFSCPVCGDSDKDAKAARCYVYPSPKMILKVKCFNCNYGPEPLINFIKLVNPPVYKQYILSTFKQTQKPKKKAPAKENLTSKSFKHLIKETPLELSPASSSDKLIDYLDSRKIPSSARRRIYYHENYTKWAVERFKRDVKFIPKQDERAVLVCKGFDGELIGTIGRTITDSSLRYNNIKVNDQYQNLVYGLDNINNNTQIRVVEGAFDSLFVDNCIAVSSSALGSSTLYAPKEKTVLIWDNEPRNKDICKSLGLAIENGHSVLIWPANIKQKDINNMILYDGVTDIESIIERNTYTGLMAKMKFNQWKKCRI